jgi:phage-related tail fiber protein
LWVSVTAQANVLGGVRNAEGEMAGDVLSVGKAGAGQFHVLILQSSSGAPFEITNAKTE